VKSVSPRNDTLRELFLKSGNLCVFPGCTEFMMDANGISVGEICNIEAAEMVASSLMKAKRTRSVGHLKT
jgi:hypothetical protein